MRSLKSVVLDVLRMGIRRELLLPRNISVIEGELLMVCCGRRMVMVVQVLLGLWWWMMMLQLLLWCRVFLILPRRVLLELPLDGLNDPSEVRVDGVVD